MSTGVRGRENITPKSATLEALDHNMHKSSLTPTVALRCDILASTDKSFIRGNVYYTVSDSVFQSLSPYICYISYVKPLKNSNTSHQS